MTTLLRCGMGLLLWAAVAPAAEPLPTAIATAWHDAGAVDIYLGYGNYGTLELATDKTRFPDSPPSLCVRGLKKVTLQKLPAPTVPFGLVCNETFTDAEAATLKRFPTLVYLDVRESALTDVGVTALGECAGLKALALPKSTKGKALAALAAC